MVVVIDVPCFTLSDRRDDVPEKICRATDSDNEEFCDSMEHLAMEEV